MSLFYVKTTRYGKSPRCINPQTRLPGWDKYGDDDTDAGYGCFDQKGKPTLAPGDCALTDALKEALGAVHGSMILVTWANGRTMRLRFNDRAPEDDMRCDIYLPWEDDPTIPDYGVVELLVS